MGQPAGVWPIRDSADQTKYVYMSDRWDSGNANQSKATNYFGSLSFNTSIAEGKAIEGYACQSLWTL
jgi:hypothetical protein